MATKVCKEPSGWLHSICPAHSPEGADKTYKEPQRSTGLSSLCERVLVQQVVTPGYVRVVKGEGMPKSKQPGQKGDLRIVFEVQVCLLPAQPTAPVQELRKMVSVSELQGCACNS